jgi:DNA-binding response OmpR family regulator
VGRRTIVVVEGSAAVQELIEDALRDAGHRVLVTRSPDEALELGRRVRIDALVADVALDRERPDIVRRLRTIQPSLPVVFLADREGAREEEVENSSSLRTPFSLGELQETVAAAVDGRVDPL